MYINRFKTFNKKELTNYRKEKVYMLNNNIEFTN